MLTLRLENTSHLSDGGPVSITLDGHGCQVGRGAAMDWVLPDPERHVSSHHFDISYNNGAYALIDVSTNGTFLVGQPYRLEGPHPLRNGDRFQVGRYIVSIQLGAGSGAAPTGGNTWNDLASGLADASDPWSLGTGHLPPVDAVPVPPDRAGSDFGDEFIATPNTPAAPQPAMAPPPPATPPSPPLPGAPMPLASSPREPVAQPAEAQPLLLTPQAAPQPAAVAPNTFVRAFCEGAGLNFEDHKNVDPEALARSLGEGMRLATQEVMAMLRDRASVKEFTRGGDRTMLGATGNNPLKFMPDAMQAVEAMFVKPADGFMEGSEGLSDALRDIRSHQAAVFAAIQPSLAQVLSGISPDEIEQSVGSGMLGGTNKAKSWDAYVERWDEKAQTGDNGFLDVFLEHFAQTYQKAVG